MIYEVEKLISRYPTNKFVITCRNAANEYQFDGFTYVEIADFSDKQVNSFVNKWFSNNSSKAQEFMKALADIKHKNLRELSHNPLLLGMLCLVYESTSNFPVKRGEVYQDTIDALQKRWDKQRGIQRDKISGFSPEIEKHLLSFLAYDYFLENNIFFEQNDLQDKTRRLLNPLLDGFLDSEAIINAIEVQHGLLAKRAHRIYTFSHLTFQEYFTARYIIDQLNTTDKSLNELFRHLYNSRWREVFLLTSSLLPSADRFFKIFKSRIRNPVKKDKQIVQAISWSKAQPINLKKEIGHVNKRMVSIALVISIGRIVSYLQTITEKRDQKLVIELIENLNLDEIDVDETTISEIIRVLIRNTPFSSKLAEKFKSLIKLSIKRSSEFDFTENQQQFGNMDFDMNRLRIRDHLRTVNKGLAIFVRKEMVNTLKEPEKYGLIAGYRFLGISFRITRDNVDSFLASIMKAIEESDIPKPFATFIGWQEYSISLYQSVIPVLERNIPNLSEEQLDILEQFLRSNILFLECLKLANVSNYIAISKSAFSIES